MKNIFKYMFVFIAAGVLFVACDNDKTTYFDEYSQAIDAASPYYVQFLDAQQSLRTDVVDGSLVNIETTVIVALLGAPQSTDIVVPLTINAASTAATDMYSLSATSVTIPAGKTSASVDFIGYAAKLVQNVTVNVIIDMDAGALAAPAGQKLTYSMFRICALSPDNIVGDWVIDMVDLYGDGWNGGAITVFIDGVGTDYTIDSGAAASHTITVPAGSTSLSFDFVSGAWDSEITFEIKGPNGAVVGADGPTPAVGEVILDACVL